MKPISFIIAVFSSLLLCCGCELVESFDKNAIPDAVTVSGDSRVAFTDVTLAATYEGRAGKNAEFGVFFGASVNEMTSYEKAEVTEEDIENRSFKVNVKGLQSGKKYFFRPVVKSDKGQVDGDLFVCRLFKEGPIDLGLPSGNKWDACNVGAEIPSDYGDYYAWAETETKTYYNWHYYRWADGDMYHILKYNMQPQIGKVDEKTVLEAEDDVAQALLRGGWRIPSIADYEELFAECTSEIISINGINGTVFISKKSMDEENFLFLPEPKYKFNNDLCNGTYYWTSELGTYSNTAFCASVKGELSSILAAPRYLGETVRAVCE